MSVRAGVALSLLGLTVLGQTAAAECLVFEASATVRGQLVAVDAPGAGSYWILKVDPPLCVDLPAGDDLGAPASGVSEVHLVLKAAPSAKLIGTNVSAKGHIRPAHGEEDRRPVVLEVETLANAD